MNIKSNLFQRSAALVTAVLVGAVGLVPALSFSSIANAFTGAQISSRSITISDSTPGATGVSYAVSFKPASVTPISGFIVDFCADSPIIGSTTCTYPTGLTFSSATPTVSGLQGMSTLSGWTAAATQGGAGSGKYQTLAYTNTTAYAPTGTGTPITFTISNMTNPSTAGTFYARILTFSTVGTAASQYTTPEGTTTTRPASFAAGVDYGGDALSTANNVSVTATVMETLQFCVSKLAPGTGCGASGQVVTTPTLVLGTGSPVTLGTSFSTDTAYTQLSTNANSGASVSLYTTSSSACAGLSRDGGSTCGIPGVGNAATSSTTLNSNAAAAFGLNVGAGSGGTGTVSPTAPYATSGSYAMSTTAATTPSPIESSLGATANVNSLLTYGALAAPTTPAGVYSTNEALIATGTF